MLVSCKMETPTYLQKAPPYGWLRAFDYGDRKMVAARKQRCLNVIGKETPFYNLHDVKLIKFSCIDMDVCFDMGIYRNLQWHLFKLQVMGGLERSKDNCSFEFEKIQDITFTNSPCENSSAIPELEEVFTVIADNAMVFLSQIKIDGLWIYYK